MKIKRLFSRMIVGTVLFFLMISIHAGTPLWTFLPLTPTTISVSVSGSATIQYTVTNKSRKSHTLVMTRITGISQITTAGNCPNPFTLGYLQSCTLTLQVSGSKLQGNVLGGPKVCQQGPPFQCYQPSQANSLNITLIPAPGQATLSASVATLALRTNGLARIITITNTSTDAATGVSYSSSPPLPAGTTITPASCGTIAPSDTCVLTIIPGGTPSAAPGDINPTPVTLTIIGNNTNTLTPTINILAYGSVYQSGYVFDFDDSTPNTGSIGGKVAALADQADPFPNGIIWSSNGNGSGTFDAVFDDIPGIYETSTNPPDTCDGNTNGACNTGVIVTYYSPPQTNPAINLSFYAAGLCKATIGGYADWYLPAICEMGYDTSNNGSGCGTQISPTIQNMQSNLVDNGNLGNLTGAYFSATEYSPNPSFLSWFQGFFVGSSTQDVEFKSSQLGVRCSRALTP
jgi:hypothetical protein